MGVKVIHKGKQADQETVAKAEDTEMNEVLDEAPEATAATPQDALMEATPHLQELYGLDQEIKPLKEKLKKLETKRAQRETDLINLVNAYGLEDDAEVKVTIQGVEYRVTPKGRVTEITDVEAAFEKLEKAEVNLAYKLMTFPITKLREYLSKKDFEAITKTVFGKKRSIQMKDVE